jgi:multiple sugar transport system substrate-binding protein
MTAHIKAATLALSATIALAGVTCAEESKTIVVIDYLAKDLGPYNKFYEKCGEATGFTFKRLIIPQGGMITKGIQLTASGNGPGIVVSEGDQLPAFAAESVVQPLDMAAIGARAEDFLAGPFSAGAYEGKQYGLPIGSNGEIIVYNKAMLEKAGIKPPTSWGELQRASKALTHGSVYGFAVTFSPGETGNWNFLTQMWSNGGALPALSSPQTVEAMDFWTSFLKAGTSPKAELHWQSGDIVGSFVAGNLAIGQIGTWALPDLIHDAAVHHVEFGLTQQVSPTGKPPLTPFGGEVLAIGASAKGKTLEAINQCIALYLKPENALAVATAQGYVPDLKALIDPFLAQHPEDATLAEQLKGSRSRTTEVGPKYPAYSAAISTATQAVAIGQQTSQQALKQGEEQAKQ